MDDNRNNQPQNGGAPGQKPASRMDRLKESTARIRKQANENFEEKPLSRRQRKKRQMQDEAVEYYYDDDAAARRAGIGCLIALLVALAILGGILLTGWNWYKSETGGKHATVTGEVQVTVSGTGSSAVGTMLEDNGLIGNGMVFRLYARYFSDDNPTFRSGTYMLEGGMSYDEIIEILAAAEAEPERVWVTVRDGVTIMAVAHAFEESGLTTSEEFLSVANDLSRFSDITFISKYLEDFESNVFHPAEGLIFPETYDFTAGMSTEDIVRQLYTFMDSKFNQDMYDRIDEMGFSLREFMSLASVVQAESGFVDENANVAGVFMNRLNDPATFPTLDSDVTLRYIKQWMQWNMDEYATMTYREIDWQVAFDAVGEEKYLAYSTVKYGNANIPAKEGVPNGPICSVTEGVINATLNYADHGYYFFVTDAYNVYYYAVTSSEHDANVLVAEAEDARFEEENAGEGTVDNNETLDDVDTNIYGGGDAGDEAGDEGEEE